MWVFSSVFSCPFCIRVLIAIINAISPFLVMLFLDLDLLGLIYHPSLMNPINSELYWNFDNAVHCCTVPHILIRTRNPCSIFLTHPPTRHHWSEMANSSNAIIHGGTFTSVQGDLHIHNRVLESGMLRFQARSEERSL